MGHNIPLWPARPPLAPVLVRLYSILQSDPPPPLTCVERAPEETGNSKTYPKPPQKLTLMGLGLWTPPAHAAGVWAPDLNRSASRGPLPHTLPQARPSPAHRSRKSIWRWAPDVLKLIRPPFYGTVASPCPPPVHRTLSPSAGPRTGLPALRHRAAHSARNTAGKRPATPHKKRRAQCHTALCPVRRALCLQHSAPRAQGTMWTVRTPCTRAVHALRIAAPCAHARCAVVPRAPHVCVHLCIAHIPHDWGGCTPHDLTNASPGIGSSGPGIMDHTFGGHGLEVLWHHRWGDSRSTQV